MNCPAGTSTSFMPTELVGLRAGRRTACGRGSRSAAGGRKQRQASKVDPAKRTDSTCPRHAIRAASLGTYLLYNRA